MRSTNSKKLDQSYVWREDWMQNQLYKKDNSSDKVNVNMNLSNKMANKCKDQ
jgi:hypothetical protein